MTEEEKDKLHWAVYVWLIPVSVITLVIAIIILVLYIAVWIANKIKLLDAFEYWYKKALKSTLITKDNVGKGEK